MGFNYGREKLRFDRNWEKLRKEYELAGMNAEDIQAIQNYDWQCFCSQRIYESHIQHLPDCYIDKDDETSRSNLFKKFPSLSTYFDESDFSERYAWIDCISDQRLISAIKKLPSGDLELLTMFAIEGYTQTEIASIMNCNQSVISRKIKRIKNFLK